ncbi:MAG: NAD(P)-binding domain-containing protein [Thiovulaceae bacterium]|nr:NAD(P)-binding domain-containing protein [Sulfurimonadaceae bacterium]
MRVAIFGCGWLGRALAKKLQQEHTVFAAVRSDASLQKLLEEHIYAFQNPDKSSEFWRAEVLVVSISPRHNYLETLNRLPHFLGPDLKQIILLSSTSVYAEDEGVVDETSPVKSESIAVQGEALFQKQFPQGTILRLGGLMGDDRVAGQWPSKAVQNSAVNYLHQVDAVGIIEQLIEQNIQGEIINAVAPNHPKRSAVYEMNAEAFGFELPRFEEGKERVVSSEKSRTVLGYDYRFDDPMQFWSDSRARSERGSGRPS